MELTKKQRKRVIDYYMRHSEHVLELFYSAEGNYPPSEEDVNSPELWKPEHWKWYIINYPFKGNI